ncbi:phosphopantetheine-binding protein [Microtetraspora malaysiensis]|uniref:Phosphopantetheine-binding protein n=1 Tax=Microtetraspora malaysiensis TaxID=161358 RepID=A0ABW6T871_9ACTN
MPGPGGSRRYRTGDRARFRLDGTLEILGRLDRQVKVRGYRIEPGEVESVLLTHPSVRQATVTVRDDRLVAYVVQDPAPLHDHLAAELPPHLMPSAIVSLDRIPLTPGGKVDLAALPAPGQPLGTAYEPPESAAEELVCLVWSEVLGLERVGVLDDFFQLGGHSLLATRTTARIAAATDLEVPLKLAFTHPTPRLLAAALEHLAEEADERG